LESNLPDERGFVKILFIYVVNEIYSFTGGRGENRERSTTGFLTEGNKVNEELSSFPDTFRRKYTLRAV
jgi:hypothetical protein